MFLKGIASRPCAFAGLVVLASWATPANAVLAQSTPTIAFTDDGPVELEWEQLQQGFQVRVQNNTSQPLVSVAARIRPASGFRKKAMDDLHLFCPDASLASPPTVSPVLLTASANRLSPPCQRLYKLPPNATNVFLLKAQPTGVPPLKQIKLILTVNEFDRRSPIIKTILINPLPRFSAKVGLQSLTVDLERNCFDWTTRQWRPVCVNENQLEIPLEELRSQQADVVLQRKEGIVGNLTLQLRADPASKMLRLEFPDAHSSQPGVYTATLSRIAGPDGKPVTMTVIVHSPWWWAVGLLALGLGFGYWFKREIGVITPTERLLTDIHAAMRRFYAYRDDLARSHHAPHYDIEPAARLRARDLEAQVRALRARMSLVIDTTDPKYVKLVASVKRFARAVDRWRAIETDLRLLEPKRDALAQKLMVHRPPVSPSDPEVVLLGEFKTLLAGSQINTLSAEAAQAQASQSLDNLRTKAELALEQLDHLAKELNVLKTAFSSLPMPTMASPIQPTSRWTRVKTWLRNFTRLNLSRLQTVGGRIARRPAIYGTTTGFSWPSWKDVLIYAIPLGPLLVAAFSDSYVSNPGFGGVLDCLKAFTWGFGTQAAVQAFFAILERLPPINKLLSK